MTKLLRKTQQPSDYSSNQIHDSYSESKTDTYSCNYINNNTMINHKDNQIVPTNEFLNGKRVYSKRLVTNQSIGPTNNNVLEIPHGITNYDEMWIDVSNSFYIAQGEEAYFRVIPIVSTAYITNSSDETSVTIEQENILIISNGGWGTSWTKVVTIKFTYND